MNDRSVFHLISDITSQAGVECVLIGGWAVNHHKFSRQTGDVDFLITQEDFEKITGLLEQAGYQRELGEQNFAHFSHQKPSLMAVDLMFVERATLDDILADAETLSIAGQQFKVPSLKHLIALKLHSLKFNPKLRITKDFPDIVALMRINGVDIESTDFKELCLKFGTEDIYRKLLEVLK